MNTKARLLFFSTIGVLLLGGTSILCAGTLTVKSPQANYAPDPIAVRSDTGASNVLMTQIRLQADASYQDIGSMTVTLEGSMSYALIDEVRVYYKTSEMTPATLGTRIDTGGFTFTTDNTLTLTMNTSGWYIGYQTPNNFVAVVFDFADGQDSSKTAACEITTIYFGENDSGSYLNTLTTADMGTIGTVSQIDDYRTDVTVTGIAPVEAEQTIENVPVLQLDLDPVEKTVTLDKITVQSIGTEYDDVSAVSLYREEGTTPGFQEDEDVFLDTSALLSSNYAELDPANEAIDTAGETYYIVVNVGSTGVADLGHTIGFRIENPSTDIVFTDIEVAGYNANYDTQKGYILESSPTTGDSFTIIAFTPFKVTEWYPTAPYTEIPREADVTAKFSEPVDELTLLYGNLVTDSVYLKDAGSTLVPATMTYDSGTRTLTIDPDDDLLWGATYTVTIEAGPTGVLNSEGDELQEQKQWSFTVEIAVHPYVNGTSPLNDEMNISKKVPGIEAVFAERVQNVTATTFLVEEVVSGTPVAGAVAEKTGSNGTIWTFTPDDDLKASMEYQVTILGTGLDFVKDMDDLALVATSGSTTPADKVWTFWTASDVPPAVVAVSPAAEATGVPIASTISAVFSKPILESTLTGHFQVRDPSNALVAGALGYDPDTLTATFTPTDPLHYNRLYTVTITADITDEDGVAMLQQKQWSFRTFGEFPEPLAAKNRIQPGVNDRTLVFIPEPPASAGGADALVTVQVFTATGKRVATLANAVRYSDLLDDLPLEWLGTNGQNDPLGPGLYFVRISAPGWVRTLKVMVVR